MNTLSLTALVAVGIVAITLPRIGSKTAADITLTGDTSHPSHSLFIVGEPVALNFEVTGLQAGDTGLQLTLDIVDAFDKPVTQKQVMVQPGAEGKWQTTIAAPSDRLGFYRVRAKLSNGVTLAKTGSRVAGFITYAVVPDPAKRTLYPQRETFFGMQPGSGTGGSVDVGPYLGIHWGLGGTSWAWAEPERSGQAVEMFAKRQKRIPPTDPKAWRAYPIFPMFKAPKWAVVPETLAYETGTLTPDGEKAWREFCLVTARATMEDYPDLQDRFYQITWEPYTPWGFKGKDEDIIRIHEIAYKALHEVDPRAVVIGPTGAGIRSSSDVEWNGRLLKKGLGKYIDALSIHAYHPIPPERFGLAQLLRDLKTTVRQTSGRDLPILATEQGSHTGGDPKNELGQARGLLRENLIMLGEGYRMNLGFYLYDYPGEPGYGYFYNLMLDTKPWGTDKIAPKPVAPGYAAQSLLLEGHRSVGPIEGLDDTTMGYAYERGDHVVLALWTFEKPSENDSANAANCDGKSLTVTLPVGAKKIAVYDWMGNRRDVATPDQNLRITLGPEPVYIEGVSPRIWGSKAAVQLAKKPLVGYPGELSFITGNTVLYDGTPRKVRVRCEPDSRLGALPMQAQLTLTPGKSVPFRLPISVPARVTPGSYRVKVILSDKQGLIGTKVGTLTVRPPLTIRSVTPTFSTTGEPGVRMDVRNDTSTAQNGAVTVTIKGTSHTAQIRVPVGGQVMPIVGLTGLNVPGSEVLQAQVSARLANGYQFTESFPINFLPVVRFATPPSLDGTLTDWTSVPPISLRGKPFVIRNSDDWQNESDLGADFRFAWDDRCLYISADVADDTALQNRTDYDIWMDDCLQLAFDLDPGKEIVATGNAFADAGSRHRNTEINVALTREGPQANRAVTFDTDKLPIRVLTREEIQLAIVRSDSAYRYEIAIPWTTLGLTHSPKAWDRIGVAVTVNDKDSPGQNEPTRLGMFGGITPAKDPGKFGVVVLR